MNSEIVQSKTPQVAESPPLATPSTVTVAQNEFAKFSKFLSVEQDVQSLDYKVWIPDFPEVVGKGKTFLIAEDDFLCEFDDWLAVGMEDKVYRVSDNIPITKNEMKFIEWFKKHRSALELLVQDATDSAVPIVRKPVRNVLKRKPQRRYPRQKTAPTHVVQVVEPTMDQKAPNGC
jgi:hypothetical protein